MRSSRHTSQFFSNETSPTLRFSDRSRRHGLGLVRCRQLVTVGFLVVRRLRSGRTLAGRLDSPSPGRPFSPRPSLRAGDRTPPRPPRAKLPPPLLAAGVRARRCDATTDAAQRARGVPADGRRAGEREGHAGHPAAGRLLRPARPLDERVAGTDPLVPRVRAQARPHRDARDDRLPRPGEGRARSILPEERNEAERPRRRPARSSGRDRRTARVAA